MATRRNHDVRSSKSDTCDVLCNTFNKLRFKNVSKHYFYEDYVLLRNQLLLLEYDEDDPSIPSKLFDVTELLRRYIEDVPKPVQETVEFVEDIHRKLRFLHECNCRHIKLNKRFPLSQELHMLLIRYVELEYEVLYCSHNYTPEYQKKVENRILSLLLIMMYDPTRKRGSENLVKNETDTCAINALYIMRSVKAEYKKQHKLIENIMIKLLRKLNILDKVNEMRSKNKTLTLENLLQVPQVQRMYEYLQNRDYATDDFNPSEDEVEEVVEIQPVKEETKYNIEEKIKVSSFACYSVQRKVMTIDLADEDEDCCMVYFQPEVEKLDKKEKKIVLDDFNVQNSARTTSNISDRFGNYSQLNNFSTSSTCDKETFNSRCANSDASVFVIDDNNDSDIEIFCDNILPVVNLVDDCCTDSTDTSHTQKIPEEQCFHKGKIGEQLQAAEDTSHLEDVLLQCDDISDNEIENEDEILNRYSEGEENVSQVLNTESEIVAHNSETLPTSTNENEKENNGQCENASVNFNNEEHVIDRTDTKTISVINEINSDSPVEHTVNKCENPINKPIVLTANVGKDTVADGRIESEVSADDASNIFLLETTEDANEETIATQQKSQHNEFTKQVECVSEPLNESVEHSTCDTETVNNEVIEETIATQPEREPNQFTKLVEGVSEPLNESVEHSTCDTEFVNNEVIEETIATQPERQYNEFTKKVEGVSEPLNESVEHSTCDTETVNNEVIEETIATQPEREDNEFTKLVEGLSEPLNKSVEHSTCDTESVNNEVIEETIATQPERQYNEFTKQMEGVSEPLNESVEHTTCNTEFVNNEVIEESIATQPEEKHNEFTKQIEGVSEPLNESVEDTTCDTESVNNEVTEDSVISCNQPDDVKGKAAIVVTLALQNCDDVISESTNLIDGTTNCANEEFIETNSDEVNHVTVTTSVAEEDCATREEQYVVHDDLHIDEISNSDAAVEEEVIQQSCSNDEDFMVEETVVTDIIEPLGIEEDRQINNVPQSSNEPIFNSSEECPQEVVVSDILPSQDVPFNEEISISSEESHLAVVNDSNSSFTEEVVIATEDEQVECEAVHNDSLPLNEEVEVPCVSSEPKELEMPSSSTPSNLENRVEIQEDEQANAEDEIVTVSNKIEEHLQDKSESNSDIVDSAVEVTTSPNDGYTTQTSSEGSEQLALDVLASVAAECPKMEDAVQVDAKPSKKKGKKGRKAKKKGTSLEPLKIQENETTIVTRRITRSNTVKKQESKAQPKTALEMQEQCKCIPSTFMNLENLITPPPIYVYNFISNNETDNEESLDEPFGCIHNCENQPNLSHLNEIVTRDPIFDEDTIEDGISFVNHVKQLPSVNEAVISIPDCEKEYPGINYDILKQAEEFEKTNLSLSSPEELCKELNLKKAKNNFPDFHEIYKQNSQGYLTDEHIETHATFLPQENSISNIEFENTFKILAGSSSSVSSNEEQSLDISKALENEKENCSLIVTHENNTNQDISDQMVESTHLKENAPSNSTSETDPSKIVSKAVEEMAEIENRICEPESVPLTEAETSSINVPPKKNKRRTWFGKAAAQSVPVKKRKNYGRKTIINSYEKMDEVLEDSDSKTKIVEVPSVKETDASDLPKNVETMESQFVSTEVIYNQENTDLKLDTDNLTTSKIEEKYLLENTEISKGDRCEAESIVHDDTHIVNKEGSEFRVMDKETEQITCHKFQESADAEKVVPTDVVEEPQINEPTEPVEQQVDNTIEDLPTEIYEEVIETDSELLTSQENLAKSQVSSTVSENNSIISLNNEDQNESNNFKTFELMVQEQEIVNTSNEGQAQVEEIKANETNESMAFNEPVSSKNEISEVRQVLPCDQAICELEMSGEQTICELETSSDQTICEPKTSDEIGKLDSVDVNNVNKTVPAHLSTEYEDRRNSLEMPVLEKEQESRSLQEKNNFTEDSYPMLVAYEIETVAEEVYESCVNSAEELQKPSEPQLLEEILTIQPREQELVQSSNEADIHEEKTEDGGSVNQIDTDKVNVANKIGEIETKIASNAMKKGNRPMLTKGARKAFQIPYVQLQKLPLDFNYKRMLHPVDKPSVMSQGNSYKQQKHDHRSFETKHKREHEYPSTKIENDSALSPSKKEKPIKQKEIELNTDRNSTTCVSEKEEKKSHTLNSKIKEDKLEDVSTNTRSSLQREKQVECFPSAKILRSFSDSKIESKREKDSDDKNRHKMDKKLPLFSVEDDLKPTFIKKRRKSEPEKETLQSDISTISEKDAKHTAKEEKRKRYTEEHSKPAYKDKSRRSSRSNSKSDNNTSKQKAEEKELDDSSRRHINNSDIKTDTKKINKNESKIVSYSSRRHSTRSRSSSVNDKINQKDAVQVTTDSNISSELKISGDKIPDPTHRSSRRSSRSASSVSSQDIKCESSSLDEKPEHNKKDASKTEVQLPTLDSVDKIQKSADNVVKQTTVADKPEITKRENDINQYSRERRESLRTRSTRDKLKLKNDTQPVAEKEDKSEQLLKSNDTVTNTNKELKEDVKSKINDKVRTRNNSRHNLEHISKDVKVPSKQLAQDREESMKVKPNAEEVKTKNNMQESKNNQSKSVLDEKVSVSTCILEPEPFMKVLAKSDSDSKTKSLEKTKSRSRSKRSKSVNKDPELLKNFEENKSRSSERAKDKNGEKIRKSTEKRNHSLPVAANSPNELLKSNEGNKSSEKTKSKKEERRSKSISKTEALLKPEILQKEVSKELRNVDGFKSDSISSKVKVKHRHRSEEKKNKTINRECSSRSDSVTDSDNSKESSRNFRKSTRTKSTEKTKIKNDKNDSVAKEKRSQSEVLTRTESKASKQLTDKSNSEVSEKLHHSEKRKLDADKELLKIDSSATPSKKITRSSKSEEAKTSEKVKDKSDPVLNNDLKNKLVAKEGKSEIAVATERLEKNLKRKHSNEKSDIQQKEEKKHKLRSRERQLEVEPNFAIDTSNKKSSKSKTSESTKIPVEEKAQKGLEHSVTPTPACGASQNLSEKSKKSKFHTSKTQEEVQNSKKKMKLVNIKQLAEIESSVLPTATESFNQEPQSECTENERRKYDKCQEKEKSKSLKEETMHVGDPGTLEIKSNSDGSKSKSRRERSKTKADTECKEKRKRLQSESDISTTVASITTVLADESEQILKAKGNHLKSKNERRYLKYRQSTVEIALTESTNNKNLSEQAPQKIAGKKSSVEEICPAEPISTEFTKNLVEENFPENDAILGTTENKCKTTEKNEAVVNKTICKAVNNCAEAIPLQQDKEENKEPLNKDYVVKPTEVVSKKTVEDSCVQQSQDDKSKDLLKEKALVTVTQSDSDQLHNKTTDSIKTKTNLDAFEIKESDKHQSIEMELVDTRIGEMVTTEVSSDHIENIIPKASVNPPGIEENKKHLSTEREQVNIPLDGIVFTEDAPDHRETLNTKANFDSPETESDKLHFIENKHVPAYVDKIAASEVSSDHTESLKTRVSLDALETEDNEHESIESEPVYATVDKTKVSVNAQKIEEVEKYSSTESEEVVAPVDKISTTVVSPDYAENLKTKVSVDAQKTEEVEMYSSTECEEVVAPVDKILTTEASPHSENLKTKLSVNARKIKEVEKYSTETEEVGAPVDKTSTTDVSPDYAENLKTKVSVDAQKTEEVEKYSSIESEEVVAPVDKISTAKVSPHSDNLKTKVSVIAQKMEKVEKYSSTESEEIVTPVDKISTAEVLPHSENLKTKVSVNAQKLEEVEKYSSTESEEIVTPVDKMSTAEVSPHSDNLKTKVSVIAQKMEEVEKYSSTESEEVVALVDNISTTEISPHSENVKTKVSVNAQKLEEVEKYSSTESEEVVAPVDNTSAIEVSPDCTKRFEMHKNIDKLQTEESKHQSMEIAHINASIDDITTIEVPPDHIEDLETKASSNSQDTEENTKHQSIVSEDVNAPIGNIAAEVLPDLSFKKFKNKESQITSLEQKRKLSDDIPNVRVKRPRKCAATQLIVKNDQPSVIDTNNSELKMSTSKSNDDNFALDATNTKTGNIKIPETVVTNVLPKKNKRSADKQKHKKKDPKNIDSIIENLKHRKSCSEASNELELTKNINMDIHSADSSSSNVQQHSSTEEAPATKGNTETASELNIDSKIIQGVIVEANEQLPSDSQVVAAEDTNLDASKTSDDVEAVTDMNTLTDTVEQEVIDNSFTEESNISSQDVLVDPDVSELEVIESSLTENNRPAQEMEEKKNSHKQQSERTNMFTEQENYKLTLHENIQNSEEKDISPVLENKQEMGEELIEKDLAPSVAANKFSGEITVDTSSLQEMVPISHTALTETVSNNNLLKDAVCEDIFPYTAETNKTIEDDCLLDNNVAFSETVEVSTLPNDILNFKEPASATSSNQHNQTTVDELFKPKKHHSIPSTSTQMIHNLAITNSVAQISQIPISTAQLLGVTDKPQTEEVMVNLSTSTAEASTSCETTDNLIAVIFSNVCSDSEQSRSNKTGFIYFRGTDHNYHSIGDPLLGGECDTIESDRSSDTSKEIPTPELESVLVDDNILPYINALTENNQEPSSSLNESSVDSSTDFQLLEQCLIGNTLGRESSPPLPQTITCDNLYQANLKQEVLEYEENSASNSMEFPKENSEVYINQFQQQAMSVENMSELMNVVLTSIQNLNNMTRPTQNNDSPRQETQFQPTKSDFNIDTDTVNKASGNVRSQNLESNCNFTQVQENNVYVQPETPSLSFVNDISETDFTNFYYLPVAYDNSLVGNNSSNKKVIVERIPQFPEQLTKSALEMNIGNAIISPSTSSAHNRVVLDVNAQSATTTKTSHVPPVKKVLPAETTTFQSNQLPIIKVKQSEPARSSNSLNLGFVRTSSRTRVSAPKPKKPSDHRKSVDDRDSESNATDGNSSGTETETPTDHRLKLKVRENLNGALENQCVRVVPARGRSLCIIEDPAEVDVKKQLPAVEPSGSTANVKNLNSKQVEEAIKPIVTKPTKPKENVIMVEPSKQRTPKPTSPCNVVEQPQGVASPSKELPKGNQKPQTINLNAVKDLPQPKSSDYLEPVGQSDMIDNVKRRKRKPVDYSSIEKLLENDEFENIRMSQKNKHKKEESEDVASRSKTKRKQDSIEEKQPKSKSKSSKPANEVEKNKPQSSSDVEAEVQSNKSNSIFEDSDDDIPKKKKSKPEGRLEPEMMNALFDKLVQEGNINTIKTSNGNTSSREANASDIESVATHSQKIDTHSSAARTIPTTIFNLEAGLQKKSDAITPVKQIGVVNPIPRPSNNLRKEPPCNNRNSYGGNEEGRNSSQYYPYYAERSRRSYAYSSRESSRSSHQGNSRRPEYPSHSSEARYSSQRSSSSSRSSRSSRHHSNSRSSAEQRSYRYASSASDLAWREDMKKKFPHMFKDEVFF